MRQLRTATAFALPDGPVSRAWIAAPVPGATLYFSGNVRLAGIVGGAWALAVTVFVFALGTPFRWWASVAAVMIHIAGAVVGARAHLAELPPVRRLLHAGGLAMLLNLGLYLPATRWYDRHWVAVELRANIGQGPIARGDVVAAKIGDGIPRVGEIAVVRIAGGAYGAEVVAVDRVLGGPGDRLEFNAGAFWRNGVRLGPSESPLLTVAFRQGLVLIVPEGQFCVVPTTAYTGGYLKGQGPAVLGRVSFHGPSAYVGRTEYIAWPWARRGPIETLPVEER